MGSSSKKHAPTDQKLRKAREEGKVAKSAAFTQLFQLVGLIVGLAVSVQLFWSTTEMLLHYEKLWELQDIRSWMAFWWRAVHRTTLVTLGATVTGTVLGEIAQVGFTWSCQTVKLRFDRFSPSSAFTKFGKDFKTSWLLLVKLFGAIVLTLFILSFYTGSVSSWWIDSTVGKQQQFRTLFVVFAGSLFCLWGVLGIGERWYRKYDFLKEQRMTDEEIRREMKDSEGDPLVKSQRRTLYKELALGEMKQRVRQARVIIVKRREE